MNLSCKSIFILILFTITVHILLSGCCCTSEVTVLEPPVLISPADGMMDISIPVVLKWNELLEAASYDLQLLDANMEIIQEKKNYGSTEHSLTENDVNYYQLYHWKVKASNSENNNQWSELWKFMIQEKPLQTGTGDDDDDLDGIPNAVESGTFHTNPAVKTLFIRPKTGVLAPYEYWDRFITLFQDSSRPGFADIPALAKAGIEVVVIGSNEHEYSKHKYSEFDKFDFNPDNGLPCHILEIIYQKKINSLGKGIYCTFPEKKINGKSVAGHTYFVYGEPSSWSWDTLGITDWGSTHDGYWMPQIFPFPIDKYFQEGAYTQIKIGEEPKWTIGAEVNQIESECSDGCTSPMNLNDNDPAPDPPYYTGPPDQTVEFNKVKYVGDGKIEVFELGPGDPKPTKYKEDKVLRRVIAHEIGHALLGKGLIDESGHCTNPSCIMFQYTLDWEEREFGGDDGANTCEHSPGESFDIRQPGIVHNREQE